MVAKIGETPTNISTSAFIIPVYPVVNVKRGDFRMSYPFPPGGGGFPPGGGGFPPGGGGFPPGGGGFPPGGGGFPPGGGGFPPGQPGFPPPPSGPPPVGVTPYAPPTGQYRVDRNSLRPCLFRYVYVWLKNGRSFWFYPVYVSRTTAAGYRWNGYTWQYYGLDLNRIASFQCY